MPRTADLKRGFSAAPSFGRYFGAATAATPLGPGQEARLAALLAWAEAYRDCYEPAPFSLRVDERFTAECIKTTLHGVDKDGPAEQQAAARRAFADDLSAFSRGTGGSAVFAGPDAAGDSDDDDDAATTATTATEEQAKP